MFGVRLIVLELLCMLLFLTMQIHEGQSAVMKKFFRKLISELEPDTKMQKSYIALNKHLDKSLTKDKNFERNMDKIIDWFQTHTDQFGELELSNSNRNANSSSINLALEQLRMLRVINDDPNMSCSKASYLIFKKITRDSKWLEHKKRAGNKPEKLNKVDLIIRHYSVKHANKCLSLQKDNFLALELDPKIVGWLENLLKRMYEAQLGLIDRDTNKKLYRYTKQIFIMNSHLIKWPYHEISAECGKIIYNYLVDVAQDDERLPWLTEFNNAQSHLDAPDMFYEYLTEPCRKYTERTRDVLMYVKQDLDTFDIFSDFVQEADEGMLNFLAGEAIFSNCKVLLKNQFSLTESLLFHIDHKRDDK